VVIPLSLPRALAGRSVAAVLLDRGGIALQAHTPWNRYCPVLPVPEAALRVVALVRAELGSLVAPHGAALAAVTEVAATAESGNDGR